MVEYEERGLCKSTSPSVEAQLRKSLVTPSPLHWRQLALRK